MSLANSVAKSFKTIIEMLKDRGYDMEVDKNVMFETLQDDFSKSTFNVILPNRIHVIYNVANKFKYGDIKKMLDDADKAGAHLAVVVVNDSVTSNNAKLLMDSKTPHEIHHIKTLQINITKHQLVPKHEVVADPDEIANLLREFSLKSKLQLPVILKTDAMARYLGLKAGDVVKITRSSPTAGIYYVYRICV
jgi:DNA-directed RNA polymerases I, II, and III subunit RPABC1